MLNKIAAALFTLSVVGVCYAEAPQPAPKPVMPQVQEIGMPDGTTLRGFIQNGVFIPVQPMNQIPQAPAPQTQKISAAIQLDQNQNQNQNIKTDANINSVSNNRNVYKEEHDSVGAITKIGGMLFQGIGMFAR